LLIFGPAYSKLDGDPQAKLEWRRAPMFNAGNYYSSSPSASSAWAGANARRTIGGGGGLRRQPSQGSGNINWSPSASSMVGWSSGHISV